MSTRLDDLNTLIEDKLAASVGDDDALEGVAASLIAFLGIAIGMRSEGCARRADALCESASILIVEMTAKAVAELRAGERAQ